MACPVNFRDVEKSVLTWHDLNESTKRHYRFNFTLVNFANFRSCGYSPDPANGLINCFFIIREDLYDTQIIFLFNSDSSTRLALHFLNDLSTGAYYSTNEFLINFQGNNTRGVWFVIFTRCRNRLLHLV